MCEHRLKTESKYLKYIINGAKPFEVRFNDREYKVGDILILEEITNIDKRYTGENTVRVITYILDDTRFCREGYVILGIAEPLSKPKPLTLEELKERDGKYVMIKLLDRGGTVKRYVDCRNPFQWLRDSNGFLSVCHINDYGETWLAYDRDPGKGLV